MISSVKKWLIKVKLFIGLIKFTYSNICILNDLFTKLFKNIWRSLLQWSLFWKNLHDIILYKKSGCVNQFSWNHQNFLCQSFILPNKASGWDKKNQTNKQCAAILIFLRKKSLKFYIITNKTGFFISICFVCYTILRGFFVSAQIWNMCNYMKKAYVLF